MSPSEHDAALTKAVEAGRIGRVRELLAAGASPDARNEFDSSVLVDAIDADREDIAALLLEAGADPNLSEGGDTPLMKAARSALLATTRLLLEKGADVTAADESMGMNALHWTVWWSRQVPAAPTRAGSVEAVRLLLAHGAPVDAASNDGSTALHMAASLGEAEITRLLLDAGASPALPNKDGFTPAHLALHRGCAEALALLSARHDVRSDPGGPTDLAWVARLGDLEGVRRLLPLPAKALDAEWRGETPLLAAVRLGHVPVAVALLEAGASPDAQDEDGRTALGYAAERGQLALVDALLASRASLEVPKKAVSPLVKALWEKHADVARRLVEAGIDVNAGSQPALPAAASRNLADLVQRLVAAGADVKKQGREAVTQAACAGNADAVRALLDAGADPDSKDENRWPALVNAAGKGYLDVVTALLDGGANIDAKGDGFAPLNWAVQGGHADLAALLVKRGAKAKGKLIPRIAAGDTPGVVKILAGKVDLAAADIWPPLTWAALLGHAAMVEALLGAGAEAAQRTTWHPPHALGGAAMHGHDRIVERLLAGGALADKEARGEALLLAAEHGQPAAIRVLVNAGAPVDARNRRARTPLLLAAEAGHLEAVRVLLELGADPALESQMGETALSEAERREHAPVVALLKAASAEDPAAPATEPKAEADPEAVQQLVDAAEKGELETVTRLIAAGVPVNAHDERDRHALTQAMRKGHTAVVEALIAAGAPVKEILPFANMKPAHTDLLRRLIDAGADVNHAGPHLPPLVAAVRAENIQAVRLLLERGADVNCRTERGATALFAAVATRQVELANLLLDAGADAALGEGSSTPLGVAARERLVPLARRLLLATVEPGRPRGRNAIAHKPLALVRAVAEGHAETVDVLLSEGVPATAVEGATKWPALHWAALFGATEIAQALLATGAEADVTKNGWTPLALAVAGGHGDLARALLEKGGDPNGAAGPNQAALLLTAAAGGHADVVDLLLNAGARVEKASQGSTALHFAAKAGHRDVARRLREGGAKLDAKDQEGRTPLVLAVHYDQDEMLSDLLAAGARADVTWNGRSLLHWAVSSGRRGAARQLIAHGVSLDVPDKEGATALHAAAWRGDHELVEALLQAKATPDAASRTGRTPLMEAAWSGNLTAVRLLLAGGAGVSARDSMGSSPADVAADEAETEVLDVLAQYGQEDARLYLSIAHGDLDGTARLLAGARPSARMVLLATRCGNADMVRALLALSPDGDLTPARDTAVAEGFTAVAEALGVATASEPRRITERMLELVKVPPPDTDVILEGSFGRYLRAEQRLETLVRSRIWMSERHSMLPHLAQVDMEMAALGYGPLGALVCERIGDVVMRGYGSPRADAFGAWNVGAMGAAVDFVSYLSDGSSVTTTTHAESKTSSSHANYVRGIPEAAPWVLRHKHELRVRRRMAAVSLTPESAEPSLLALARAVDRSLLLRFES